MSGSAWTAEQCMTVPELLRSSWQCMNCWVVPDSAQQCLTVSDSAWQCLNCWAMHDSAWTAEKFMTVHELLSSARQCPAVSDSVWQCLTVPELLRRSWQCMNCWEVPDSAWTAEQCPTVPSSVWQCLTVPELLSNAWQCLNCWEDPDSAWTAEQCMTVSDSAWTGLIYSHIKFIESFSLLARNTRRINFNSNRFKWYNKLQMKLPRWCLEVRRQVQQHLDELIVVLSRRLKYDMEKQLSAVPQPV